MKNKLGVADLCKEFLVSKEGEELEWNRFIDAVDNVLSSSSG